MALMEMVEQLTKGFVKATGRQPDNLEKLKIQQEAVQRFKDMNKVVDMEGNVIDTSKGIMGGRQIQENKELSQAIKEELMKKDNPYSDLVKTTEKGPKSLEQRRKEAEEALKNKNVVPIKDPEDMATGGRAGFAGGTPDKPKKNKKITRREEDMGPYYETNDPEEALKEIVRRMINVEPAKIPLSKDMQLMFDLNRAQIGGSKDIGGGELNFGINKGFGRDDTGIGFEFKKRFAEGGRIGLKAGMTKRAFLKLMGITGAGIAGLKSGILGLGKGVTKQAAKEVVQQSTTTPPAYFFELANKIKTLGRVSDGPAERIKIHSMPAKDGKSELMLTEDIGTGEMQIKKIGKEEDMTTKVETMEYTPGSSQADETTQGIPADSYDEFTEVNSRIIKDEYNDPIVEDGINVKEIVEEVVDQAPSIKKAGGGIARMLGE